MAGRRRSSIGLLGLAGVLGVGFFVVTVGVWPSVRAVGDVAVASVVVATVLAAGVNGYRDGPALLSVGLSVLVAGGHLAGEYVRSLHAIRLPPAQSRYFLLVAVVAVAVGGGSHFVGRAVASSDARDE